MKIQVKDLFVAGERTVEVPDRGVTVVTGRNGVGKSTLFAEPFAWALFGKTLRGVTVKKPCSATLDFGPLKVKAVRTKTAANVAFGDGTPETATKGWKSLGELLGLDFDLWHRTHVFSIEKVAKFSAATDSERKSLLEALLGLDKYERAQKVAKEEHARANVRFSSVQARIRDARFLALEAEKDLERAEAERASAPDVAEIDPGEAKKIRAHLARLATDIEALRAEEVAASRVIEEARQHDAEARADLNAKIKALASAKSAVESASCPTCDRPFDADHDPAHGLAMVHAAEVAVKQAREGALHASQALQEAGGPIKAAQARRSAKEAEVQQANRRSAEIDKSLALAEMARKQRAALEGRIQDLEIRLEERQKAVVDLTGENLSAGRELDVLKAAVNVLGVKGIRARLLDQGLAIVEAGANEVLEAMGSPGRISLSSTRPKADGTTADEIGMTVTPWGGDDGYDGSSGGERKRIDIAMVVGAAGLYRPPPTLKIQMPMIFDDVFDTLDPDGIAATVRLMGEIGKTRPVIVITQNTELADRTNAAARFDL